MLPESATALNQPTHPHGVIGPAGRRQSERIEQRLSPGTSLMHTEQKGAATLQFAGAILHFSASSLSSLMQH